jgi:DNA-directed RNA polymerase subunit RPC12/RpoP
MAEKTIKCPKCGHENILPCDECVRCGSSFALFSETRSVLEEMKQEKDEIEEIEELLPLEEDQDEDSVLCPKCGHENPLLSEECTKCGIIFAKYYEIQARTQEDEEEREEALRKKEEAEQRAEALRKQREEEEKAEALRKQKEADQRAEALKKQKEEEEKAEALKKQKEEEEKAEALRKQKEKEEKAEALKKQKEEEERAEALKKQKEEEKKAEALKKQKEEEKKAEALKKQKEEEKKAEALRKQKEGEEREDRQKIEQNILKALKPKPKIKDLLKKYEGQAIGINYDNPTDIKGASLARVNDDHFSILIADDQLMYSFPLTSIISIIEGVDGVSTGISEKDTTFSVVIKVYLTA